MLHCGSYIAAETLLWHRRFQFPLYFTPEKSLIPTQYLKTSTSSGPPSEPCPHLLPGVIFASVEKTQNTQDRTTAPERKCFSPFVLLKLGVGSAAGFFLPCPNSRDRRAQGCPPQATSSSWAAPLSHKRYRGRSVVLPH